MRAQCDEQNQLLRQLCQHQDGAVRANNIANDEMVAQTRHFEQHMEDLEDAVNLFGNRVLSLRHQTQTRHAERQCRCRLSTRCYYKQERCRLNLTLRARGKGYPSRPWCSTDEDPHPLSVWPLHFKKDQPTLSCWQMNNQRPECPPVQPPPLEHRAKRSCTKHSSWIPIASISPTV